MYTETCIAITPTPKTWVSPSLIPRPSYPCNRNKPNIKKKSGLRSRLHNLKPILHHLQDILVFMLELIERISNVIPLSFILRPRQSARQLSSQLFSMFVLILH
jgi:hypothetical protein